MKDINRFFRRLSVADEIEKEHDGALPYGDDMVRGEMLGGGVEVRV